MPAKPDQLLDHALVAHFEAMIREAFTKHDSIGLVSRCLVQAISQTYVMRYDITEAYEVLDI